MRLKLTWVVVGVALGIGLTASASQVPLVAFGSTWKFFLGTQEASAPVSAWRTNTFNDASWPAGPLPIGYPSSDPSDYDPSGYEGTIATLAPVGTQSVFCRTLFYVPDPTVLAAVDLAVRVDDGYVVWLNGTELDRFNVPEGEVGFDAVALNSIETTELTVHVNPAQLRPGINLLAIQVFNQTSSGGDLLLDAALVGTVDDVPPSIVSIDPPPGTTVPTLPSVEVVFSEPVQGVKASDLLINGSPAVSVTFGLPGQCLFEFAPPPTGAARIAFAPNQAITDLAVTPNAFVPPPAWTNVLVNRPNVILNEIMAAGQAIYVDEDREYPDWIELFNAGATPANLAGWFLTDDPDKPAKWRFPAVTLGAGNYLVVFASGKNRTNTAANAKLHTNFQLGSKGEYLALLDPGTNVVSAFAPYPNQSFGVSYGQVPGSPDLLGYFSTPTPGKANAASGAGFAPEVQFSRPSGTFVTNAPFGLALSTPLTNATIYYVLGTNVPGTNSLRYTNAVPISNHAIVRARAFAPGLLPGPIVTKTYIALAAQTNIVNFRSDLPVMILHNFGGGAVPSGSDQYVVVQTFEPRFGQTCLTNTPELAEQGIFHLRGSSTLTYAKGSFRLEMRDEFRVDKHVPLLGLPADSDWVLYAPNNFEPVLFHNPLAHQLLRDMGAYGSHTRFVEVYLKDDTTTNSPLTAADYNGIYVLEEKIKISPDRVDIPVPQPEDVTPPAVTGGYILAIDRSTGQPTLSAGGATMQWVDPGGTEMANPARAPQVAYLTKYFNDFNTALNSANWTNPVTGYAGYIDVASWVNFHIHEVVTYNVDGFRLSGYFYKPRAGKLCQGPSWDYDRTQGSTDGRDFNPFTFQSTCGDLGTDFFNPSSSGVPWWDRLFRSVDFWQRWIDRYQEAREGPLSYSNVTYRIEEMASQVRHAQPREQAKWAVAPRSGAWGACGYTYTFPSGGYESEVNWIKFWYTNRLKFIDTNFLARPRLNGPGGQVATGFQVTLQDGSAKTNTVLYYTLDGTDPRASGGAIGSNALAYNGPISVTNNVRVVARAYNAKQRNLTGPHNPPTNSFWSGSVSDLFYVAPPPLRITELMYHPAPLGTNDPDSFEFIELRNTGLTPLNLYRFQLRGGVEFNFPSLTLAAGQTCVVVADTNAFALRYGANSSNILLAGQYTNHLGNGGDHLVLLGPVGEPILDFHYSDQWYPTTDGTGFSLVMTDPTLPTDAWSNAGNWAPSRQLGGSPGQDNGPAVAIPPVLVNEILTHTDPPACDAVELYNPTGGAVDLGGWFLTDDFATPKKYRLPPGTSIAAGDYVVLYATNSFGEDPPLPGNVHFQFSSQGDQVYLFSGDAATNLTGYAHGFDFGAQFVGATFGRYVASTAQELFVSQVQPTLGGPNAGPRVGPVVISEIMYRPPDLLTDGVLVDNSQDEYVELLNISGEPVPLYDPAYPTNTWQVRHEVDYAFPTNAALPAGGYALVVNFDASDPALAGAFRARYGVPAETPLFGPYGGKLNNDGGRIDLMRPDHPELTGTAPGYVPYVLAESVSYRAQPPWPTNNIGAGAALQRIDVAAFGDDPANWRSAGSSAGTGFSACDTVADITRQPADQTVVAYRSLSAQFTVAASGPGPLRYQWFWNDLPIQDGTGPTLEVANVTLDNAGVYRALVLNCAGVAASATARLTALMPVVITQQPTNAFVKPGANTTLSVTAYSTSPVKYQWRFNGVDISGATNRSYSVTNATLAKDGNYQVLVSDPISSELSQVARVKLLLEAVILSGPQSQIVPVGATVDLDVQVADNATLPVSYILRKNNNQRVADLLLNQRALTFTYTNVALTNSGAYWFGVTNQARLSSFLSSTAFVAVVLPPTNLTVDAGADAALTVVVGNPSFVNRPAEITFQWQFNGAPLTNETGVDLGTNGLLLLHTNTLKLPAVQPLQAGAYGVLINVITNVPVPPALFTATLNVIGLPDRDGDGMPDAWELAHGLNPDDPSDALTDADGDGMSNLAEYLAGTDPQDPQSYLKVELEWTREATNVVVKFGAVSNKTYSVLCQDLLTPASSWAKLANVDRAPTNRTVRIPDPSPSAWSRFYRLVTPWKP